MRSGERHVTGDDEAVRLVGEVVAAECARMARFSTGLDETSVDHRRVISRRTTAAETDRLEALTPASGRRVDHWGGMTRSASITQRHIADGVCRPSLSEAEVALLASLSGALIHRAVCTPHGEAGVVTYGWSYPGRVVERQRFGIVVGRLRRRAWMLPS
jgi:hypothetical protein